MHFNSRASGEEGGGLPTLVARAVAILTETLELLPKRSDQILNAFPAVYQMAVQTLDQGCSIAGFQSRNHLFVLLHCIRPVVRTFMPDEADTF